VTGRRQPVRVTGWVAAVAAAGVLAVTGARAAELPVRVGAFAVLAVAALALAIGALLAARATTVASASASPAVGGPAVAGPGVVGAGARWRAESIGVEVTGHAVAVAAVLMTVGSARYAAGICTLWGVVLGARALLTASPAVGASAAGPVAAGPAVGASAAGPVAAGPAVDSAAGPAPGATPAGRPLVHRPWPLAMSALASEIVAWWLLLVTAEVSLTEAYTLPPALAALVVGWLQLRTRPQLSSWIGYGPGLAAALLPSLGSVLVADGQPLRRLLLGAGAVLVVLAGSAYRRQAPVVLGGVVLTVLALRELVAVWDLLPRWSFLAVGGLALITLAVTYERRRRDLRRLRSAVGRMS
jgi:hypothetical protein